MTIRIDLDEDRPLEEQIVTALRTGLAQGLVGPGQELPSARQLAGDLGVHWNTVARAYRRLADEGLLSVRPGRSVVAREQVRTTARVSRTALRGRFTEAVAAGVLGGLSRKEILGAFREALAGFGQEK
jgi:GntR family transcriptional regulator